MMTVDTQIEAYLSALRAHLGPMTLSEREEIVREIGAHIRDSVEEFGASVPDILARLGPADVLAAHYQDGLLIRRASQSLSPFLLLRGAMRLATKGVFGILVFFVGMIGYAIGGGLVLTALVKPILPANTGLWVLDGHSANSGVLFPPPAPPAYEVLGFWYIPIVLTLGSLILFLTMGLIRSALRISGRWQSWLRPASQTS
jgi:hypothetical protein